MSDIPAEPVSEESAVVETSRPWAGLRAATVCLLSAVIGFSALAASARFLSGRTENAVTDASDELVGESTSVVEPANLLETGSEPLNRSTGATAEQFASAIDVGDQLLLEGNAAAAWREYEWAFRHGELEGRPDVHFRMGLSSEHLGDFDRALVEYRLAASAARDDARRVAALMGQARVWVGLGKRQEARSLLSSLWLTSGEWDHSAAAARECVYALADTCVRDCVRDSEPEWSDGGLLLPAWQAGDVTTWLTLMNPAAESNEMPPIPPGVQIAQKSLSEPEGVFVRLNLTRLPLETAIESLCGQAGFSVTWTPAARQSTLGRTVQPTVRIANLGVCLDLMTAGTGLSWTSVDGAIQFVGRAEVSPEVLAERERRAAARVVTHAILQHADTRHSPRGYLALGNLTMLDDRPAEAASYYQQLLRQFPRADVKIEAWFNLAKAQLAAGQTGQALDAFYHVVDGGSGHPVEATAYLYIGRLILESGDARRAASAYMRSSVLARNRHVRSLSVLGLSAAFLLSENPAGADLVLMEHRQDLVSAPYCNAAAYLGAAARHDAAQQDGLRAREAQNLLASLGQIEPASFFGSYGWHLLSGSFEVLGLDERAAELRGAALKLTPPPAFHGAMTLSQAEWLIARARSQEAMQLLTQLAEEGSSDWASRARIRMLEFDVANGEPQTAVLRCRERLASCDSDADKRELLRLMGAAYQRAGDHTSAALCYSGRDPAANSPNNEGDAGE